jgi:sugar lactone lactonase YvrE
MGKCLTKVELREDGSLGEGRVFADLTEVGGHPDGLCIDDDGAVWYADTMGGCVVRVSSSGQVIESIPVPARHATSCALVGESRRTLLVTVTDHLLPEPALSHRSGRVLATELAVRASSYS